MLSCSGIGERLNHLSLPLRICVNYKNFILATLLFPACCLGNTLEQLEEELYQKGLELRELRKIITEGDEYIRNSVSIYWDSVRNSANNTKKRLDALAEENDTKKIDLKELEQKIFEENECIYYELANTLNGKQKFDRSLFYEICGGKDIKSANSFNSDKFLVISILPEMVLMMLATIKYEKCLREFLEINKKILAL